MSKASVVAKVKRRIFLQPAQRYVKHVENYNQNAFISSRKEDYRRNGQIGQL